MLIILLKFIYTFLNAIMFKDYTFFESKMFKIIKKAFIERSKVLRFSTIFFKE